MNRRDFRMVKLFIELIIHGLDSLMEGHWNGLSWKKKRDEFYNELGRYSKEEVPKK